MSADLDRVCMAAPCAGGTSNGMAKQTIAEAINQQKSRDARGKRRGESEKDEDIPGPDRHKCNFTVDAEIDGKPQRQSIPFLRLHGRNY